MEETLYNIGDAKQGIWYRYVENRHFSLPMGPDPFGVL